MLRRIALLLLLVAAEGGGAPLLAQTLDDVKSGTLFVKTNGFYVAAPTVETSVNLQVRGMILRGEVVQRFRNAESSCVEAVYVFPLPEDAAVDRLRMTIGERVIEGEVKERQKAEEIYQQAKSEGKKATLLSQERPNIFTSSISNIGAGEEVVVTIDYQQALEFKDGSYSLRFPMTIGPRYLPMSVTDGEKISPPPALPGEKQSHISLTVDLDSGFSLRSIDAPHDKVEKSVVSGSHYVIGLKDVVGDHDFVLNWQPDLGSEPKSAVFAQEGYALMLLMPPAVTVGARMPKDSIFIIDTSGSMEGTSIREAKAALQLALDRLDSHDRFNVIEFNSVTHTLFNDVQPATPQTIAEAKAWVEKLVANGGTEMLPALEAALHDDLNGDGVRQIIFMTDGQAGNENECFALIRSKLGRSRLFTVGIGAAPNSHFMREAARFGRGTFTYIADTNEVQEKMSTLFGKLESPVMTNVEVRFDDPTAEFWPQRVPDLYAGEPVVVAVKLGNMKSRVIVSGERGSEAWHDTQTLEPVKSDEGIGRLWARRKIEALSDESIPDAQAQITQLALEHHLVTQYTSLVAVDVTPSGVAQQTCPTTAVPSNLPKGWGGIDGTLPSTATPAPLFLLLGISLISIAALIAIRS